MLFRSGVDFLEPLKPAFPALAHTMTFPWLSAIVMIVLLKVALMCATPSASTTFFERLVGVFGFATFSHLIPGSFSSNNAEAAIRGWCLG